MNTKDLETVPLKPGVYLWKDTHNQVIYVGKAKNLKTRMRQYFSGMFNSYKTPKLGQSINSFDYIVTSSEKEALILEKNLITKYRPKHNILLIDDKRYPYLKITLKDKLEITLQRKYKKSKDSFFYGPFPTGEGAIKLKKLLEREAYFKQGLPIQNKDITFWKIKFEKLKEILKFNNKKYVKKLKIEMNDAANKMQFEIAKDIRDSIIFLNKIKENQNVELQSYENYDVIGYQEEENLIFITLLIFRFGSLLLTKDFTIDNINYQEETMRDFLNQYYENNLVPTNIIMSSKLSKNDFWFNTKLIFPQKGKYKKLLDLAIINANQKKVIKILQHKRKKDLTINSIQKLEFLLGLDKIHNIMMVDNSHHSNTNVVSVFVSYKNGNREKSKYKKFNLKLNKRYADVDYMKQSVTRYFSKKENFIPDLFIVDGGIAQLHEVKQVLRKLDVKMNVISLVKNEQHITKYLIDLNEKKHLIKDSFLLNFLRKMQKEVDHFAKSHYRKRHLLSSLEGYLTLINGIGHQTEKKLLKHFKTYSAIYNASLEELSKITSKNNALKIKNIIENNLTSKKI